MNKSNKTKQLRSVPYEFIVNRTIVGAAGGCLLFEGIVAVVLCAAIGLIASLRIEKFLES